MSPENIKPRVLLCICDGMGLSDNRYFNAVFDAKTPHLDFLFSHYPHTTLEASGEAVGLPAGVAGNSEVGHMNLGAGRPVRQDLVRINEAIANKTLIDMPEMQNLIKHTLQGPKRLHLMGLLSDGGVHSHLDHCLFILNELKRYPEIKIFLHGFLDGRDTPQQSALPYIEKILATPNVQLASLQGRSFGMDRDRRYEKVELGYKALIGSSPISQVGPMDYVKKMYAQNIYDEFIPPIHFLNEGSIKREDSVFFFNFRPDRAKEITLALNDPHFSFFPTPIQPQYFTCMSPYVDEELPHLPILFNREKIPHTLGAYLAQQGIKQLRIAETEKYAHVTYFFNGGEETPFEGEDRILVPSPRDVATYDLKPEMSALEVLAKLIEVVRNPNYQFILVNFANPDMVGHTGNYAAAIKAMETIDQCLKTLTDECTRHHVKLLITADHGNCDQMKFPDGEPCTSHSTAPVPFIAVFPEWRDSSKIKCHSSGALKDVAPTILHLLKLPNNASMTGINLIQELL